jgi:hypothetical protein
MCDDGEHPSVLCDLQRRSRGRAGDGGKRFGCHHTPVARAARARGKATVVRIALPSVCRLERRAGGARTCPRSRCRCACVHYVHRAARARAQGLPPVPGVSSAECDRRRDGCSIAGLPRATVMMTVCQVLFILCKKLRLSL